MALKSKRFAGDPKLEQAAISDPAHILIGASGTHVTKIQFALIELDGALIAAKELAAAFYGPSTAGAVLAYKRKRNIINKAYQHQADNIVGKISDKTGKKSGNFSFEQPQYKSEDFQNAFGAIDRVDFEFDFDLDECTVWFKDFYEWHPVYDKLYELKDGDEARFSNCFHAAFVEMKTQDAKDYTMIGQNTVPIATAIAK